MLPTWVAADLARGMRFTAPQTAFYEVAERAGGPGRVSSILFAMACDGKLPAILVKVHPRYKTPYFSTLAVAVVSLLVGLLFAERVDDLTRVVNFGALTGFVLLHVSVISHYFYRLRKRRLATASVFSPDRSRDHRLCTLRNGSRRQTSRRLLDRPWHPLLSHPDLLKEEGGAH